MDRRAFLTRGPAAMAGLFTGGVLPKDELPERQQIRALLDNAERMHVQACDLIHWPWRSHEARPLVEQCAEALAEAWLRGRGVQTKLEPHYTWLFITCHRPDDVTGLPWRAIHLAIAGLERHCDPFRQWSKKKTFSPNARAVLTMRAREALVLAMNCTAECIEKVRYEAAHR
ncbi:MAG: hypothetical protein J0H15_02305 [Xanthomonadales bacterium]|nr:hypothetical protein [Xanthomonadales bacterium]